MFDLFDVPRALKIKRLLFAVALLPPLSIIASIVLCFLDAYGKITIFTGAERLGFPAWWEYACPSIVLLFLSPFLFLVQRKWGIVNPQIAAFKGSSQKPFKEDDTKLYILKMAAISALGVSFLAICGFICVYLAAALSDPRVTQFLVNEGSVVISIILIFVCSFCCFLGSLLYLYISRRKYRPDYEFDL